MHSQGGETSIQDSYSRWGVKGSNEVSEGLTAVYRYEEGLDLAITTLRDNNRLSYVGLSGGFGTVTMGRIWSASYNHLGALTDTGIHNAPNTSTSGRTSNALSYSASTGPVSFQIDANMNEKEESKRSVDMAQLGMSFDTGAAKIGLAFVNSKSESDSMRMSGIGVSVPVGGLTLYSSWTEKKVTTFATPDREVLVRVWNPGTKAQSATHALCKTVRYANAAFPMMDVTDDEGTTISTPDTTRVVQNPDIDEPLEIVGTSYRFATLSERTIDSMTGVVTEGMPSCQDSSLAPGIDGIALRTLEPASPAVQEVPPSVNVVTRTVDGMAEKTMKTRHMHAGVSGSLGDTGMSFAVNVANHPDSKDGIGENPWNFNVSKSLGGGASLAFEYVDYDESDDNEALLRLKVDF